MRRFLLTTAIAAITMLNMPAFAQQPDDRIHIKIDADVNGEKLKIDTFINSLDELDLEQYMQDLGLEEELNQLNIDIRSGFNMGHFWDSTAMRDMMQSLGQIQIPPMPMMPDIPQIDWSAVYPGDMEGMQGNKALLGVFTDKVPEGALITELMEEGAAKAAGLQEGDIITMIDKRTIESPSNLTEVIGMYVPGDEVSVTYLRNGQTGQVRITLQENKGMFGNIREEEFRFEFPDSAFSKEPFMINMDAPARGFLGVYLEDKESRVIVTGVEENSAASEAGLQEGDVIEELNNTKVTTYDDVIKFMKDTKPGDKIKVTYIRDGKKKTTDATLKENNGGTYFFKFDNEDEGYLKQNIEIVPMMPCPPGSTYSYSSTDGKKQVNICISAIEGDKSGATMNDAVHDKHGFMDPNALTVYSNPSDGTFNVRFTIAEVGDTFITITDMSGKEVYTETLKNFSGTYDRAISLGSVSKGNYFVKVTQNGYNITKTLVVQ